MSRALKRGRTNIGGKLNARKHIGVKGSEVSFNVNLQAHESESNSFPNTQHNNFDVFTKIRGTGNRKLLDLTKDIWDYLLKNGMTITTENLPNCLNVEADCQSRNPRDSSEWKLPLQIFIEFV